MKKLGELSEELSAAGGAAGKTGGGKTMALPRVVVRDRKIVLLSGFETSKNDRPDSATDVIVILEEEKLQRSVQNEKDAVAFGYVSGRWVAAA